MIRIPEEDSGFVSSVAGLNELLSGGEIRADKRVDVRSEAGGFLRHSHPPCLPTPSFDAVE